MTSSSTARGVQLQYRFLAEPQTGSQVDNPLFDLLSAVATQGSIQGAAKALDLSYRHLWGSLKQWEETVGQALVVWQRGQPARLTAFAEATALKKLDATRPESHNLLWYDSPCAPIRSSVFEIR